jgi:hypothetical protein
LGGNSSQRVESDTPKKLKNETHENGSGKQIVGKQKKELDQKTSDKPNKPRDGKSSSAAEDSTGNDIKTPPNNGDAEEKSKVLQFFGAPPAVSPPAKKPSDSESLKPEAI